MGERVHIRCVDFSTLIRFMADKRLIRQTTQIRLEVFPVAYADGIIARIMLTSNQRFRYVVESLRLVAAPAVQQMSVLPDFVSATDEVSTTFGDAYLPVPQLVAEGMIGSEAAALLASLDDWFDRMPTDGSICGNESLGTHEFWETARRFANAALRSLGEEAGKPELSHIGWVE